MEQLVTLLIYVGFGYLLGLLSGVAGVIYYGRVIEKRRKEEEKLMVEQLKKEAKKVKSPKNVQDRLNKVASITKTQLEIAARAEEPSKNALHSKYKNDLMQDIRALEQEKNEILRTILKDGHDPMISLVDEDGSQQKMNLSQYMSRNNIPTETAAKPPANDSQGNQPRKVGKFFVYTGKNDTNN